MASVLAASVRLPGGAQTSQEWVLRPGQGAHGCLSRRPAECASAEARSPPVSGNNHAPGRLCGVLGPRKPAETGTESNGFVRRNQLTVLRHHRRVTGGDIGGSLPRSSSVRRRDGRSHAEPSCSKGSPVVLRARPVEGSSHQGAGTVLLNEQSWGPKAAGGGEGD